MNRQKPRIACILGIGSFGLCLLCRQFFSIPELLAGAWLSISICLEMIGALPESRYQALKAWKKSLLRRTPPRQ